LNVCVDRSVIFHVLFGKNPMVKRDSEGLLKLIRSLAGNFLLICVFLNFSSAGAEDLYLPKAGQRIHSSQAFAPLVLTGLKIHPDNPFQLDFILDQGDSKLSLETPLMASHNKDAINLVSTKLIKYFLTAVTIPKNELWVNLSPYEKDRIIPESFGRTEMGRDLLAQDYVLKQLTSSLIYPEDRLGKEFWGRVYRQAEEKFHTTDIPINTFNKVWIVPDRATVYEHNNEAYIVESKLKVMLQEDYLSLKEHRGKSNVNTIGSDIVRQIIIPELAREVNQGKNFAELRQVYQSLILAAWYKRKLEKGIMGQVYMDQRKISGINLNDPGQKQRIYHQYLAAFKKGVFSYIKEENDPLTQKIVTRKYFSGGVVATPLFDADGAMTVVKTPPKKWLSTAHRWLLAGALLMALPAVEEAKAQAAYATGLSSQIDPLAIHLTHVYGSTNQLYVRGVIHSSEKQNTFLYRAIMDTPPSDLERVLNSIVNEPHFARILASYSAVVKDVRRLTSGGQLTWALEDQFGSKDIQTDMKRHEQNLPPLEKRLAGIDPALADKVLLLYAGPAYYLDAQGELPKVDSVENTYLSLRQGILADTISQDARELNAIVPDKALMERFFKEMYTKDGEYLQINDQRVQEIIKLFVTDEARLKAGKIVSLHKLLIRTNELRTQWMGYRLTQEVGNIYYTPGAAHVLPLLNSPNWTVVPYFEGEPVIGAVQKKVAERIIVQLRKDFNLFQSWSLEESKDKKDLTLNGGEKGRIVFHLSDQQTVMSIDVAGEGIKDYVDFSFMMLKSLGDVYPRAGGLDLNIDDQWYDRAIKLQINQELETMQIQKVGGSASHQADLNVSPKDLGGINFDTDLLSLRITPGKDSNLQYKISREFLQELRDSSGFSPIITYIKSLDPLLSQDLR